MYSPSIQRGTSRGDIWPLSNGRSFQLCFPCAGAAFRCSAAPPPAFPGFTLHLAGCVCRTPLGLVWSQKEMFFFFRVSLCVCPLCALQSPGCQQWGVIRNEGRLWGEAGPELCPGHHQDSHEGAAMDSAGLCSSGSLSCPLFSPQQSCFHPAARVLCPGICDFVAPNNPTEEKSRLKCTCFEAKKYFL